MPIAPILTIALSLFTAVAANAENHAAAVAAKSSLEETTKIMPTTYINSDKAAYDAMLKLPTDEPLYMLNMIRFKDKAVYKEGSEFSDKGWSGAQAYAEYRRHAGPIVARLGGKSAYEGKAQLTLIGPEHEQWDVIFIVYYPNVAAMIGLVNDPEYKKHAFHRSAGVADSRLIRMASVAE